jgi:hypothetical protein
MAARTGQRGTAANQLGLAAAPAFLSSTSMQAITSGQDLPLKMFREALLTGELIIDAPHFSSSRDVAPKLCSSEQAQLPRQLSCPRFMLFALRGNSCIKALNPPETILAYSAPMSSSDFRIRARPLNPGASDAVPPLGNLSYESRGAQSST